jgi:hypothetical protein
MRSIFLLGALAALAVAALAPQLIDLDAVAATEVPPAGPASDLMVAQADAFDAAAAAKDAAASVQTASEKVKRTGTTCARQPSKLKCPTLQFPASNTLSPDGFGPKATPDTPEGFLAF